MDYFEECVHHKDGNKCNNNIDNLVILSTSAHSHLHMGYKSNVKCPVCDNMFVPDKKGRVCCSKKCSIIQARKFDVSAEELYNLVWSMPTTEVAKLFAVSGKAIEKRCKLLGVTKPPRGYWSKKENSFL